MKRFAFLMLVACSSSTVPPIDNSHVASCTDESKCGNGMEPPPGGPHCSSTLACRVFTTPQGRCQYIHNLEHGHLVLAYNCPSGCDDVVQELRGIHAAAASPKRVIVTPDPLLKTRVAAMVWGHTWAGDTVDLAKIRAVQDQQDRDAPEAGLGCAQ